MPTPSSNTVRITPEMVGEVALFAIEMIGPVEISFGFNYDDPKETAYLVKGNFYGREITIVLADDGIPTNIDEIKDDIKRFVYNVILNQGEVDMNKPN